MTLYPLPDGMRLARREHWIVAQAPAVFGTFLVAETEKWSTLIKKLGVQAD